MARTKQPGRGMAYVGTIAGASVSIAANIAHSFLPPAGAPAGWSPEPGAVVGAVVWPVFLFLAIEVFVRVVWPKGWSWAAVRWGGLLPVAGVAGLVSYRHLSGLLAHYGEERIVSLTGPLAIDGLMIMCAAAIYAGGRVATESAHGLTTSTPIASVVSAPPSVVAIPGPQPGDSSPHAAPDLVAPFVPAPALVEAPNPAVVAARVQARQATGLTQTDPAGTAPDSFSVTTAAPARRKSNVTPGQLSRARHVAKAYQLETGADISAGELAVRMRCSTEQAGRLLAALERAAARPSRDNNRNGTLVAAAVQD